jgi:hypothetical protein
VLVKKRGTGVEAGVLFEHVLPAMPLPGSTTATSAGR